MAESSSVSRLGSTLDASTRSYPISSMTGVAGNPAGVDADEGLRSGHRSHDRPRRPDRRRGRTRSRRRQTPREATRPSAGRSRRSSTAPGSGRPSMHVGPASPRCSPVGRVIAPDDGQDATPAQPEPYSATASCCLSPVASYPCSSGRRLGRGQQVADTEITGPQPLAPRQPFGCEEALRPGQEDRSRRP